MRWREFGAWQGLARKRRIERMNERRREETRRRWYAGKGVAAG